MSRTRLAVAAAVCLSFTGVTQARAQEPHEEAPKEKLLGATVELGSLAGFARFRGDLATAIGGDVAGYIRLGPALIGAEYGYLSVGPSASRGTVERTAIAARLDLVRMDRHFGGPNTALVFWADGSLGRQRGQWHDETAISRNDVGVGWGWLLEHRVRLSTRPRRLETIGWKFGWRLTAARPYENEAEVAAACVQKSRCDVTPREPHDIGMVVSSSLRLDW